MTNDTLPKRKIRLMESLFLILMIRSEGNYINPFKKKNEQGKMDSSLEQ